MTKKMVVLGALVSSVVLLAGCMSGNSKPDDAVATTQTSYTQYQQNRPDPENKPIGNTGVDKITSGIAGIYDTTIDLTDKTIAQIENSEVATKLNTILHEQGKEAWEKAANDLEGEDEQQYKAYLNNEVKDLPVVTEYLKSALKLQQGIAKINPTSLVSNPFEIASVIKSVDLAKNQIGYSVQALNWMKKNRDLYQMALTNQSR